jgi:predicted amidohydrolase
MTIGAHPIHANTERAAAFIDFNRLLKACSNAEGAAALLLSTCRNAYLTSNALFRDLQILLGDGVELSPLRSGAELMMRGADPARLREQFGSAIRTVREYQTKKTVWNERHKIWEIIQQAKSETARRDKLAPVRIDQVLAQTRTRDVFFGDGRDTELLELNLSERPHLDKVFRDLQKGFAILQAASGLGKNISDALMRSPQPELNFDGTDKDQLASEALRNVPEDLKTLVEACQWTRSASSRGTIVHITTGHRRPQGTSALTDFQFSDLATSEVLRVEAERYGMLLREALYLAHWNMCEDFDPNVARSPMPPLFQILLPMASPGHTKGHELQPEIVNIRCGAIAPPSDPIRIALADFAVPLRHLNLLDYRFSNPDVAQKVAREARKAIQLAADQKCQAIAFPEYSLPRVMIGEMQALADTYGLVIVGGLEGDWSHDKLLAQGIVAIPGENGSYFQSKQIPSLEEEAERAFFRDGKLYLFSNTPIGDFAVVMCSDFRELANLQVWRSNIALPDLVFVVARNDYPELYVHLAHADAVRLYTHIAVANVADDRDGQSASCAGSCLVVPNRDKMLKDPSRIEVGDEFLAGLAIYPIQLTVTRARSRGKPVASHFAVPRSALRQ